MIIASYLVGRDLGVPVELLVKGTLPDVDNSVILTFEVGERIAGDRFGENLFLNWSDSETGADLLDIVLPNLPQDVVSLFEGNNILLIKDTENNIKITLETAGVSSNVTLGEVVA